MVWHGILGDQPPSSCSVEVSLSESEMILLMKLAEREEFWDKSLHFIRQVNGVELSRLSPRQLDWYYAITDNLAVLLNRIEARVAFGKDADVIPPAARRMFNLDRHGLPIRRGNNTTTIRD